MSLFNVVNDQAQFDAASNVSSDVHGAGIRFTQAGAARVTTTAGTFFNQGIPMSDSGQVAIVDATAGLPSDTVYLNGLPISANRVCVSRNARSVVSNGLPFDSNGAIAGAINFDLNFIGTDTLDPQVTFTRASTATFFNSAGVLTSAATNAPRFDYNPATLAAQGLLIEESRTNSIRNNTMQGAAAGTPGTLPTNWAYDPSSTGLSRQVVATGTDNGINYVDLRVFGTAAAANYVAFYFETSTGVAAVSGQTWTGTYYLKLTAGSTTGLTTLPSFGINEGTSGGVFVSGGNGPGVTPTAAWQRVSYTRALSGGGTVATILPFVIIAVSNGAAIDITLRIGLPQLEQGAFATSVIPTTTTALTRAADVASVNTLSPWYNASAGTIYAEYNIPFALASGAAPRLATFIGAGGPVVDELLLFISQGTGKAASANAFTGSVNAGRIDATASFAANTVTRATYAFAANDRAVTTGGSSPTVSSAAYTIPTVTLLRLGADAPSSNFINGYLRRIVYYPRRLSNAELQSITS